MVETLAQKIAVGDQVRVHFHPPGPWKSFSEGVVRRVDVTTQAGRFFVLEVRNEVLLDQPHRIRPGLPWPDRDSLDRRTGRGEGARVRSPISKSARKPRER